MSIVITLFVTIGIVIPFIYWAISTNNTVNSILVDIENEKSNIEIALQTRYDILSQAVQIVQMQIHHEKGVFTNLHKVSEDMSLSEISQCGQEQIQMASRLFALVEAYPDLQSSESFQSLLNTLKEQNNNYVTAKKDLNDSINLFNNYVVQFPTSIICSINNFYQLEFVDEGDDEYINKLKHYNIKEEINQ